VADSVSSPVQADRQQSLRSRRCSANPDRAATGRGVFPHGLGRRQSFIAAAYGWIRL